MGESKEKAAEAAPAAGGGSGKMIIIAAVSSVISVVAALAVVMLVIVPKLSAPAHGEEGEEGHEEEVAAEEGGGGGGGHGGGEGEAAPKLDITFDELTSTVVMPSPDIPSSILVYQVVLYCANANAASLIEANKPRFAAKIRELHSYKKRAEFDTPQLESDIETAMVQECNAILQEILGKPSEKTRIKGADHLKFFIQDL
ncbi:MAG: hypothetical protein IT366_10480 [Candidatus Hydrogenedentes bacterium]|nr:hypothetical protein [Candidatus Hydrogenedentota bacterium]